MNKIDVSVVLNMHREAPYLRPTLLSLDACALEARRSGLVVELVAVFDCADEATREVFRDTALNGFDNIKTVDINVGSLGLARNAGVERADGEFVWTADGDDLVSSNAIVALVKTARNHPHPNVAVFIEFLAAFGEQFHVVRYFGSERLTAADVVYQHPFVSRIFIRRSVFEALRYIDLKLTTGFAYEDWDFNARLIALGFDLITAPDTVFFYRQRNNSLLRQANALSAKIIPQSPLFELQRYCSEMSRARERVGDWSVFVRERQAICQRHFAQELFASEKLKGYVSDAAELDPEVEPLCIEAASSYCPIPWDSAHWGFQLEKLYRLVGVQPFDTVVLLPWLKPGGAEKYILQILHELKAAGAAGRVLVLSGESANRHEWTNRLPEGTVFVDVFNGFPTLSTADRDAMVVRLLLAISAPEARLHIKSSAFSHRLMDGYGSVLSSHFKIVYYRFSDGNYYWNGGRLNISSGVKFLRRHLGGINLLVSDCNVIAERDHACVGIHTKKYQTIYAQCATRQRSQTVAAPKQRLLWASRISKEKRPELVGAIATALRRDCPSIVIEVYGQVDAGLNPDMLFNVPGVEYRGSFDGFECLPVERFDGFLYTSAFDGLPNIILEVMGAGLPVIAPDVGGIAEAVIDGVTGFLVPDLIDDAALVLAYIDTIRRMYSDWALTCAVAERGRLLIEKQHGPGAFKKRVAEVFDFAPVSTGI